MPGPVPKRSEERRRRNGPKPDRVPAPVEGVEQPPGEEGWHPVAAAWYASLAKSGQAVFYQPSDWEFARLWAEVLSRQLQEGRMNAQLLTGWSQANTLLLASEGSRRSARLEIERAGGAAHAEEVAPSARSSKARLSAVPDS